MDNLPLKKRKFDESEIVLVELKCKNDELAKEVDDLKKKVKCLTDEYVLKIPKKDFVYHEVFNCNALNISEDQMKGLMKDGRYAFAFIDKHIRNTWKGISSSTLQVKMFTYTGVKLNPSSNIGTKRSISHVESRNKINDIEWWVFVNITSYPNIRYIFKSNKDVLKIYNNTTNGHVTTFSKLMK